MFESKKQNFFNVSINYDIPKYKHMAVMEKTKLNVTENNIVKQYLCV